MQYLGQSIHRTLLCNTLFPGPSPSPILTVCYSLTLCLPLICAAYYKTYICVGNSSCEAVWVGHPTPSLFKPNISNSTDISGVSGPPSVLSLLGFLRFHNLFFIVIWLVLYRWPKALSPHVRCTQRQSWCPRRGERSHFHSNRNGTLDFSEEILLSQELQPNNNLKIWRLGHTF